MNQPPGPSLERRCSAAIGPLARSDSDGDDDQTEFEFGLDLILDGLDTMRKT
jgi:hypothetical protein